MHAWNFACGAMHISAMGMLQPYVGNAMTTIGELQTMHGDSMTTHGKSHWQHMKNIVRLFSHAVITTQVQCSYVHIL